MSPKKASKISKKRIIGSVHSVHVCYSNLSYRISLGVGLKVLITGASGFIGKHLTNYLLQKEKYELVLPLRPNTNLKNSSKRISIIPFDGLNAPETQSLWREKLKDIDAVIHLAAQINSSESQLRETNIEGTRLLAEEAAKAGVKRFIFMSTIKVNGETTTIDRPFSEDSPPTPTSDYAKSKYEAENQLKAVLENTNTDWVIIRPPLVWSENAEGNISSLIQLLKKGLPLPFGSIRNQRSIIKIESLCKILESCMENPRASNNIFLVSEAHAFTTAELIKEAAKISQSKAKIFPFPTILLKWFLYLIGKRDLSQRLFESLEVDSQKSRRLLNWERNQLE